MRTPPSKAPPRTSLQDQTPAVIRAFSLDGDARLAAVRRLVVLVPAADVDEAELARRIWELAAPAGLAVMFLGLCARLTEEPAMRRRLITLASLTGDSRVPLETRIEFGKSWLARMKAIRQPGDVILCHAEQNTGLSRRPLSRALESLGGPVWTLAGFYTARDAHVPGLLAEVIFWVVSIVLLAAFFWLQFRIVRLQPDWARTMLLYLSILAEAGLLGAWHHFSV